MATTRHRMVTLTRWNQVPDFSSESEEVEFWKTHQLSEGLLGKMRPDFDADLPKPRPRTKPVSIRFDETTISRVRTLAERRGMGYQTLVKEFIFERLYEEEKREGII